MSDANRHERLAAYADGELAPELVRDVEQLLDRDASAKAEVERWQALRAAAQRGLDNEPVPAGLESRLLARLRAQSGHRGPRLIRLGAPWLAVAAALILAVTYWPQGAQATAVEAGGFAKIYRACAHQHRHDDFRLREMKEMNCAKALAQIRKTVPFKCDLPDMTACGKFYVDGACVCAPAEGLPVVHVYFRNREDPQHVVSVFIVDRCVKLCANGEQCGGCCGGHRKYVAGKDGDVNVLCWTEKGRSYLLACGRLDRHQLVAMADNVKLAATMNGK